MQTKSPLKVIIVGGSIAGLTLAHSLSRIDIDWEILDGHEIAPPIGASIAIFQNGCMVLDQLGIYDDLRALVDPLRTMNIRVQNGRAIKASQDGAALEERFGYSACLLTRQRLIQLLYDRIPDKGKIHAGKGKRVLRVEHSDGGVEVSTEDGSTYQGDLVVAADGIHSTARSEMWRNADAVQPGSLSDDKSTFVSDYTCLFGIADPVEGLPGGNSNIVCGTPVSFLTFIGLSGEVYFFLYKKMSEKHTWPDSPRFSKEDGEAMANTYLNSKVTEDVTFGDIWKKRKTFTLLPMEEGVLKHWCWGRFAVVGDAAHKMTVNIGQGGNSAIEGAAALANALHSLVTAHRGEKLTTADINDALCRYETSQRPRLQEVFKISAELTRLQGLESPKGYLFLLSSLFRSTPLADISSGLFLKTSTLNYLPKPSRFDLARVLRSRGGLSDLAKSFLSFLVGWSLCYLLVGRH